MRPKVFRSTIVIFLFSIAFCFTGELQAQGINHTVSGFIKDRTTGEFLSGSSVLIYRDSLSFSNPPLRGSTSNQYGYFAIPNVQSGKFLLVARRLGYRPLIKELPAGGKEPVIRIDLELEPQDIRLQEVVVKGKKSESGEVSSVDVSPGLLSQLPSLSGEIDLFRSLQMLPGLTQNNELSSGLYVRGGSPDETLTLLDGVVVYNPSHLGNFASTFNSDALQNVRLIKGAYPAEYGGRLSSVLDIKLRSGSRDKHKGILGLGIINSHLTLEGPMDDNSTYILSGRKMYYDAFQKMTDKNGMAPRYNFYDINSKFSFNASGNDIVSLSALLSRDQIYSSPSNQVNYDIQWQNAIVSLNWSQVLSNSRFSNTSFSYVSYNFKSILDDTTSRVTTSDYYSSSELQDLVFKKDVEFYLSENNLGKLGLDLSLHDYKLIYSDVYSELIERSLGNEKEIMNFEAAVYLQSEWQVSSRFKLSPGLRLYYFNDQKKLKYEPRLSMAYSLTDEATIKGAFSVTNQFLHMIVRNDISLPTDLWYPSTNRVEPSSSRQYVLGVDSYFWQKEYLFSVEGYYKDMKNLYEFKDNARYNPQSTVVDLFTKGNGEAYGVEFFLNKISGDLSGWIGYTLSWTRRKFDELNAGQIFYPRYDRRHDISVLAAYKISESLTFSLTWTFATGQGYTLPVSQYQIGSIDLDPNKRVQFDYTARNAYKLPDYHKLDLNVTYRFYLSELQLETYLNIYNVYDRKNPFAYYASDVEKPTPEGTVSIPKFHSITLFPFLPTVGVTLKF
ncbi:MAG: TonB-dependent receptor [Ignavibacteria bacterium]|jgi:outer membrane receptor for ferrienterochelin and colicin|nr:TonB-dependent receptor [Ignavibacteria bacterium]